MACLEISYLLHLAQVSITQHNIYALRYLQISLKKHKLKLDMKLLIISTLLFSVNLLASTILVVGDSHSVGPFGTSLHHLLKNERHDVSLYASCGSIPEWWMNGKSTPCGFLAINQNGEMNSLPTAKTPLIENLLTNMRPDVVIMEFGGNYAGYPSDEFVIKDIEKFIWKIKNSGAKCFFVTNPDTRKQQEHIPRILNLIKSAIKDECPIFESYKVTSYPSIGGDGIHYSFPAGKPIAEAWAWAVFQAFKEVFP